MGASAEEPADEPAASRFRIAERRPKYRDLDFGGFHIKLAILASARAGNPPPNARMPANQVFSLALQTSGQSRW